MINQTTHKEAVRLACEIIKSPNKFPDCLVRTAVGIVDSMNKRKTAAYALKSEHADIWNDYIKMKRNGVRWPSIALKARYGTRYSEFASMKTMWHGSRERFSWDVRHFLANYMLLTSVDKHDFKKLYIFIANRDERTFSGHWVNVTTKDDVSEILAWRVVQMLADQQLNG